MCSYVAQRKQIGEKNKRPLVKGVYRYTRESGTTFLLFLLRYYLMLAIKSQTCGIDVYVVFQEKNIYLHKTRTASGKHNLMYYIKQNIKFFRVIV